MPHSCAPLMRFELDQEIVVEEVDRIGGIGEDAADGGRGDDHGIGGGVLEKLFCRGLVAQVQLGPGSG